MGKIGGLILLTAVALTGCSAPAAGPAPTVTATVTTTATVEAAPIPAASIPASTQTSAPVEDVSLFLKSAKARWVGTPPADDVLLSAGKLACQQMLSGTDVTKVKVVEASGAKDQSLAVAVAAQDGLCPETIAKG